MDGGDTVDGEDVAVRFGKLFPGIDVQLKIDNRENVLGILARNESDLVVMERLFSEHKIPLNVVMEMPSNETIKQAVMAGMGLSFLSMRTVRHELAGGYIALVDIEGLPQMGHWYVTHLAGKKLSPVAKAFKAFLIEQGGALMDSWS